MPICVGYVTEGTTAANGWQVCLVWALLGASRICGDFRILWDSEAFCHHSQYLLASPQACQSCASAQISHLASGTRQLPYMCWIIIKRQHNLRVNCFYDIRQLYHCSPSSKYQQSCTRWTGIWCKVMDVYLISISQGGVTVCGLYFLWKLN